MFKVRLARKIERSGLLEASRRILFTASPESSKNGRFELYYCYQFGSCVVVKEKGVVYSITASHVIRNATRNDYMNSSPFAITPNHPRPGDQDFLYPMRYYDFSPSGEHELDVGVIEITATIFHLGMAINLDDESNYIQPGELIENMTAVVSGYPEETNQYECKITNDEEYKQIAIIKREFFRGTVTSQSDGLWFNNFTNQKNYAYSGLSGGVVVCCANKDIPKPLGIVVSCGENGRRFKIIPFYVIKSKVPFFEKLDWEVIDEAYFIGSSLTHSQMKYDDFARFCSGKSPRDFIQKRTNVYLEQIERSIKSNPEKFHYIIEMKKEVRFRVVRDLVFSLICVMNIKIFNGSENSN